MCSPTAAFVAVTALSSAYSAQQQYQQGRYQEGVAEYNARVAENEAQKTREVAVERENIQRRKTAELISKQRAQLGAANVDITSGSALQLQEDAMTLGEVDALRIRSNFEDRAASMETGAELTRQSGAQAARAGRTAAFGSLLAGGSAILGSGVADKWFTPASAAMNTGNPSYNPLGGPR